jgi:hypothetical protein
LAKAVCVLGGIFGQRVLQVSALWLRVITGNWPLGYIEKNSLGTSKGWRWQRNWQGMYCIVIDGRLIENNWMTEPE